jgi:hypothetical protein
VLKERLQAWLQHHFIWRTQRTADVRKLVFDEAVKAIAMFEADALKSAGGVTANPMLDQLFDYSSEREQHRRDVEADRVGGLEVKDQLVLRRRLHRQIGRLLMPRGCDQHQRPPVCRGPLAVYDRRRLIGHELPVAVLARPDCKIPVVDVFDLALHRDRCGHPAGD